MNKYILFTKIINSHTTGKLPTCYGLATGNWYNGFWALSSSLSVSYIKDDDDDLQCSNNINMCYCCCAAVYQVYLVLYRRAGVEPPTYAQFRAMFKVTGLEKFPGRGDYEDF